MRIVASQSVKCAASSAAAGQCITQRGTARAGAHCTAEHSVPLCTARSASRSARSAKRCITGYNLVQCRPHCVMQSR
jgi:hypothetical protein